MAELDQADLLVHWQYNPAATSNIGVSQTGDLPAGGAPVVPTSVSLGAHMQSDEVWEVLAEPVITFDDEPVAGTAPQEFTFQWVNGSGPSDQVLSTLYYNGAFDLNYLVPPDWREPKGEAIPSMANAGIRAALRAAKSGRAFAEVVDICAKTLKVGSDFTFAITPVTTISRTIDIKIYGKRWQKAAYNALLAGGRFSGTYARKREIEQYFIAFPASWPALGPNFANWTNQPGGVGQGTFEAMPWATFSINTVSSTLNQDLLFGWYTGAGTGIAQSQVQNATENLVLNMLPGTTDAGYMYSLTDLGARSRWQYASGAGTALNWAFIRAANDQVFKYHPQFPWRVTDTDNPLVYGRPMPAGQNNGRAFRLTKFVFPMYGDEFSFGVRDNGVSTIAPGQVAWSVRGTRFKGITGATITRAGVAVTAPSA